MVADPLFAKPEHNFLADPPRRIPATVLLRLLVGSSVFQIGCFIFAFVLIFVWVVGGSWLAYDLAYFSGDLVTTQGVATRAVKADWNINGAPVCEFHFTYAVGDVYYQGMTRGFCRKFETGDPVTIEYHPDNPARARLRTKPLYALWVILVVCIFPVAGLAIMTGELRKGFKGARLLRHGLPAVGVLISKERTNTKIGDDTVYKYSFRFQTQEGREGLAIAKTHDAARFPVVPLDDDGQRHAPLLYDPNRPSYAVMLDALPGQPRIGEHGDIQSRGGLLIKFFIIPLVTIVGHGGWLLHVLQII